MEEKKQPGFMIYVRDWLALFDDFELDEIGLLLRATIIYFQTGEVVPFDDRAMRAALRSIKSSVDVDCRKYDRKILQKKYAAYCRMKKFSEDDPNKPTFEEWKTENAHDEE